MRWESRQTLRCELAWPPRLSDRAVEHIERRRLRRVLDDGWDDLEVAVTAKPLGLGMLR